MVKLDPMKLNPDFETLTWSSQTEPKSVTSLPDLILPTTVSMSTGLRLYKYLRFFLHAFCLEME